MFREMQEDVYPVTTVPISIRDSSIFFNIEFVSSIWSKPSIFAGIF
jgi:hypothetical protein